MTLGLLELAMGYVEEFTKEKSLNCSLTDFSYYPQLSIQILKGAVMVHGFNQLDNYHMMSLASAKISTHKWQIYTHRASRSSTPTLLIDGTLNHHVTGPRVLIEEHHSQCPTRKVKKISEKDRYVVLIALENQREIGTQITDTWLTPTTEDT